MWRKAAVLMVLLIGIGSLASEQTSPQVDARALLVELGKMLEKPHETNEECQELLELIESWQKEKLAKIEAPIVPLRITNPEDGDSVPWRPYVEGTVADPDAEVWVIVHPMEVSDYWVQPSLTPKEDGTWNVQIHIGRPGEIDVGKRFEIRAVANPKEKLYEGKVLKDWPKAQCKSQVVEVTRK